MEQQIAYPTPQEVEAALKEARVLRAAYMREMFTGIFSAFKVPTVQSTKVSGRA